MSHRHDDHVETLLREQFEGPVADSGFCARVMDVLPHRPRRSLWPVMTGIAAGTAITLLFLLSSPLVQLAMRDWLHGSPSAAALLVLLTMTAISLLALGWTSAEADER
jgi:predicted lysophospholipase L1 biosynthesis ABC-type transport system permease subunit